MKRIIDQLRELFPGTWRYNANANCWIGPAFTVEPRAHLAPRYDGDDDTFVTRYYRTDTQEEILGLLAFEYVLGELGS